MAENNLFDNPIPRNDDESSNGYGKDNPINNPRKENQDYNPEENNSPSNPEEETSPNNPRENNSPEPQNTKEDEPPKNTPNKRKLTNSHYSSDDISFLKKAPHNQITIRNRNDKFSNEIDLLQQAAQDDIKQLYNTPYVQYAALRQQGAFIIAQKKIHATYETHLTNLQKKHQEEKKALTTSVLDQEKYKTALTTLNDQQNKEIKNLAKAINALLDQLEFNYHNAPTNAEALYGNNIIKEQAMSLYGDITFKGNWYDVNNKPTKKTKKQLFPYEHYEPETLISQPLIGTPNKVGTGAAYYSLLGDHSFENIANSLSLLLYVNATVKGTPENPNIDIKFNFPKSILKTDKALVISTIANSYIKLLCMRDSENPDEPAVKKLLFSDIKEKYGDDIATCAALNIIRETGLNPYAKPPEIILEGINLLTNQDFFEKTVKILIQQTGLNPLAKTEPRLNIDTDLYKPLVNDTLIEEFEKTYEQSLKSTVNANGIAKHAPENDRDNPLFYNSTLHVKHVKSLISLGPTSVLKPFGESDAIFNSSTMRPGTLDELTYTSTPKPK